MKDVNKIVEIMEDKKAEDIKVYDVTGKVSYADYVVLCNGSSDRNIESIVQEIRKTFKKQLLHIEGKESEGWVLVDLGDYIVNVFSNESRAFYKLEEIYENL